MLILVNIETGVWAGADSAVMQRVGEPFAIPGGLTHAQITRWVDACHEVARLAIEKAKQP